MKFDPVPARALGDQPNSTAAVHPTGLNDERIGGSLECARVRLLGMATELAPRLDSLAQPLLTESRKVLERRTCRIAVIGQIKAGKSTFINALAGRPGLLPADINPWTAVVTLLQFRNSPTQPVPAARFQLFSASEWNNLAEGAGRLRELTEQLIPDFRPDLLKAQFQLMRARAERRLGPSFAKLLGETHSFEHITRDLLTDYVSAGDDFPKGDGPAPRSCYSDITRTAELFFSEGPFAFPITLIDTPGTNDPFLVRDEITRRSLENPDIFIFVISALQPLTSTDISMLRLINGLHKDRILVFVNRVDQLADPVLDGERIKVRVEQRLRQEFPALDIPVVLGSAAWANASLQAQSLNVAAAQRALTPALLAANGLPALRDPRSSGPDLHDRAYVAHALYVASGLPRVGAALNRMIAMSASAALLSHIGSCLLELAKGKEIALRMELNSLSGLLQSRQAETAAFQDKVAQERQVLAELDKRAAHLHGVLDEIEGHLGEIVTKNIGPMRRELHTIVKGFAQDKAEGMEKALRKHDGRDRWVCNVMPLREELEACYLRCCRQLGSELSGIENEIQPVLRQAVEMLMPGSGADLDNRPRGVTIHRPSVQPLRQTVVLDLSVAWWKVWFAARPDPVDRAEHLRKMIDSDFAPITAELVREAESYFGWYIAHTLDKARAVAESMLANVRNRNEQIIAEFEEWQRKGEQPGDDDFEAKQCRRAVELSGERGRLVADIGELTAMLTSLNATMDTGM